MISADHIQSLLSEWNNRLRTGEPLSTHTSLGIGGPAAAFLRVTTIEELALALTHAHNLGCDTLILGGGTNLLVSDTGFDGLVIRVDLLGVRFDNESQTVTCGAGVSSAELVEGTIDRELGGLQFAAGLPGTVGGAIAGNAGCYGCSFGDRLVRATVVHPDGRIETIEDPMWFDFAYRHTRLAEVGAVVADVTLRVRPTSKENLRQEADEHLATRATKHPTKGAQTAGSYFKNLPPSEPGGRRVAAGSLLDQVGAKQMSSGDAAVFEKHANILINRGGASAADVLQLASQMAQAVREAFDVTLEPEVRFVGTRP